MQPLRAAFPCRLGCKTHHLAGDAAALVVVRRDGKTAVHASRRLRELVKAQSPTP